MSAVIARRRSDEAIQTSFSTLDCFASLAMTETGSVGWAKARSAVPTDGSSERQDGGARFAFAHPTERNGASMNQQVVANQEPRTIKLNARDNVAIVVNDFGLLPAPNSPTASRSRPSCHRATRPRWSTSPKGLPSSATARSSAPPSRRSPPANGWTKPASTCRRPLSSTSWKSPLPCRRRCRRSMGIRSKAFVTPTARSAPATCWASRRPCNAWKGTLEFAIKRSRASCCRITRMSTTSSR